MLDLEGKRFCQTSELAKTLAKGQHNAEKMETGEYFAWVKKTALEQYEKASNQGGVARARFLAPAVFSALMSYKEETQKIFDGKPEVTGYQPSPWSQAQDRQLFGLHLALDYSPPEVAPWSGQVGL